VTLRLVVVQGVGTGAQLRLRDLTSVDIGCSPTADFTLVDADIAEVQLKLFREGDRWTCFDVTRQGFVHDGQRVMKAELAVGSLIQVGSHGIRLIADLPEQMPSARAPLQQASGNGGPVLMAIKGNEAGKAFALDKPVVIIGRGVSSDVTIWDIRASRAHCRVDRQGDLFRVSDLNSSNGTYVHGHKITTHDLREGDVIKIGGTMLRFHPHGAPAGVAGP